MEHLFIPRLNLQLFAEGGAPAGDGGSAGTGVSALAAGVQSKGGKGNPLGNVAYGGQKESAPAAGVQNEPAGEPSQTPDRKAEFERMIKGEYKDVFHQSVQNILQPRLKSAKETEDRLAAMNPMMDLLAAKYGKKADDIQGIYKALESDNAFFEQAAADRNMDAEQYKEHLMLRAQNERYRANEQAMFQQQMMNQRFTQWQQQAETARAKYPSLDLGTEMQNPQFCKLLDSGVDVETAYWAMHRDDLVAGAMHHATTAAKQQVANSVAAGKNRPAENGGSGQAGVTMTVDPSKMTREERRAYIQRAARGERIEF